MEPLLTIFKAAFWMTYRIFTHPLNKYPGPFFAQLSDIYNGYHAFKRRLHLTTWVNQQRYGKSNNKRGREEPVNQDYLPVLF
jgi:hypothetical protein